MIDDTYEVEFIFAFEKTVKQVDYMLQSIYTNLNGCISDIYFVTNGLEVTVEFDYNETPPQKIRKWLKDKDGVTADLEGW